MKESSMIQPDNDITVPAAEEEKPQKTRWIWIAFISTAFIIVGFFYRFLMNVGFGHTSLMFIGLPFILAVLLALAPKPKTTTGSIMKGITLALLVVAPLMGEGYLCILIASPLFLLVGLIVGLFLDSSKDDERYTKLSCVALVLVPFSLEGAVPWLTHNRMQTVEATQTIHAPVDRVQATLAQSPDVTRQLPVFLRIGFPRPIEAHGGGLTINDHRTIHFTGAEGDPPGDLTMQVAESRPGYVRFETIGDTSKLTQWIYWRSSEVTYTTIDETHTSVTWRIRFDRQLDPFWYFGPWERFAVRDAAQYLILANATPKSSLKQ
jgi:hypothetical protein